MNQSVENGIGKVALVTGAGSGIGRATSIVLMKAGYSVVLAGRRDEKLQETVRLSGVESPGVLICPTDVTREAEVNSLFANIKTTFGRLDVLFNNAGVSAPDLPADQLSFEQWQTVVNANLTAPFLCAREAIRIMKAQQPSGGRIINNGSLASSVPRPNSCPYAATKHGITGLTRALALDCRKHGIAVSQIDIGNARTDMAQGVVSGALQANGEVAVEPTMDVAFVADAVLQMANLPLEANILEMKIMATGMPFVGRG